MNKYTVFYKVESRDFEYYIVPNKIQIPWFNHNYREVRQLKAEGLEDVYYKMQGEVWSPNGEARELIQSLGLSHTSMNVGDVIYSHAEEKYYWCSWIGFDEVQLTSR